MNYLTLFLLLICVRVTAQKERRIILQEGPVRVQKEHFVMPQGWYGLTPFKWRPGLLPDSSMYQITTIKINLEIVYSWGGGDVQYVLEYRLRDSFFETHATHFQYSGKQHPPTQKGQGATNRDSVFQQRFEAKKLFQILHNSQQPSPYWCETDFDYTHSKFYIDLMQLPRSGMSGYKNCQDCTGYHLDIQFLKKEKIAATIDLYFDSGFRLPKIEDTAIQYFKVRSMLEWMYLYQLSHLFFPENEALNKSHFHEKSMEWLAIWARKFFPELND